MTPPSRDLADPLTASRFFNATRQLSPPFAFVLAPFILLLVVIAAALEGDVSSAGNFSRASDLRHLLGLSSSYISAPVIPLARDALTLVLVLLVGYTFACAYAQCCAISVCIPELERSGLLRWRTSPRLDSIPRIFRRSVRNSMAVGPSSRLVFADWLDYRMSRIRRAEPMLLIVASILAAALQFVILKARSFQVLAPYSYSHAERRTWERLAYRSWWASYYHWPGAVAFFLIATFAIFIILLQNAVLTAIVSTASVLFAFAEPGVDWLNVDGHYGWLPVERVFRASYLSIGLRGLSLSALIIGFGERNTLLFLLVAVVWLVFVLIYHVVPYRMLFTHLNSVRRVRIDALARESKKFRKSTGLRRRQVGRFYATEIQAVREAHINPMHLPKWQLSTFAIAVLLPVVLTVIQLAF
jgi:hypothetical protein